MAHLLASNPRLQAFAKSRNLQINHVAWEDTARNKKSCLGPNISDMTLAVGSQLMPMIRRPNFADKTADFKLDQFKVSVGNEVGASQLEKISLEDYLTNISKFASQANLKSLLCDRDKDAVLTSSQFCVVPEGGNFAVQLFNYQSNASDPAVLVVLASADGTSAQVVTERNQKIFFNKNGRSYDFTSKRLSVDRKERGVSQDSKEMTQEEQEKNALFVFQIPLKKKMRTRGFKNKAAMQECAFATLSAFACPGAEEESMEKFGTKGIEDAILSLGSDQGLFTGINGLEIERDTDYPIRCTIQFYQVTDNPELDETIFDLFNFKISKIEMQGNANGSLVLESNKRKTEFVVDEKSKMQTIEAISNVFVPSFGPLGLVNQISA